MGLRESLENYIPFNEQEEKDKEQFLRFIDTFDDVLSRDNIFGHFSASAFVVNKERNKMVVVYHLINDGWICPGGHADGNDDLLSVAVREVLDENIYSIQSAPVKGHIKHGKYVSAHLHLDVIYLMEADDKIPLIYKEDESTGVTWVSFDEAYNDTMCDFIRPIHKKLIEKLRLK